ncbi:hypothetical protein BC937DRAFT_86493 [Endogone sp. FLAS-F59071]|nr:hypothetical protein BC937DRAFT_86493 [Endogone sp. FLAS-F59071]|eukprot:RUS20055.1 hypothetical protein BC937DRAFT_86493 [Endogone sp. FLAS-F59071]
MLHFKHLHMPQFCKSRERPANCNAEGTHYITKALKPNPHRPKDFVKHSLYWKRTGLSTITSITHNYVADPY